MFKSVPVKIVDVVEPWCTAVLEDGSIIRAKLVFVSIYRQVDPNTGEAIFGKGPRGEIVPSYEINSQSMIAVEFDGNTIEEHKKTAEIKKFGVIEGDKEDKSNVE